MALVKGHTAVGLLKEALVLDLGDLGRQAARLQAAAEAKARQIVAEAQAEAARRVDGAHGEGLAAGRAEGLELGRAAGRQQGRDEALRQEEAALRAVEQGWLAAAREWDARATQVHREAQTAVLELALQLAERLVHRIVQVDPTVIADQVAAALAHVLNPMEVTVHMAPADRGVLERAMPELLAEFAHLQHVRLVDDETVEPGGCVLHYGHGQVDATLGTQLRRVVDLMLPAEDDAAAVDGAAAAPTGSDGGGMAPDAIDPTAAPQG